jgi:hypothetical protein
MGMEVWIEFGFPRLTTESELLIRLCSNPISGIVIKSISIDNTEGIMDTIS